MKKLYEKLTFVCIISMIILTLPTQSNAQFAIDTASNFYDITSHWDNYYDSIIDIQGAENMGGTGYKHYMHWKTEWEPRVQPSGDFLPYLLAVENSYGCFESLGYYDINGVWDEIGPVTSSDQGTDDVGRLSCIEIDPADSTIILCGSPEGGLYYTENTGGKWYNGGLDNPKEDHGLDMFTPGIASIIITHVDTTTYWIVATGDKDHMFSCSRGVLRSKDKGQNWELINGTGNDKLPGNWYYIRKLIQHPNDPEIIFAATSMGLYKTENALDAANAVEWELVLDDQPVTPPSGTENHMGFFDIEFHKTKPDTMFMSIEYRSKHEIEGNEILWSTDGGYTWDTLPYADDHLPVTNEYDYFLSLLELSETNHNIIYIYTKGKGPTYNAMWKYEIDDEEWTQLACPFYDGNGRNGFAVSPVNENLIYAATVNTYVTYD